MLVLRCYMTQSSQLSFNVLCTSLISNFKATAVDNFIRIGFSLFEIYIKTKRGCLFPELTAQWVSELSEWVRAIHYIVQLCQGLSSKNTNRPLHFWQQPLFKTFLSILQRLPRGANVLVHTAPPEYTQCITITHRRTALQPTTHWSTSLTSNQASKQWTWCLHQS